VNQHVVEAAVLAALTNPVGGQHAVCRASELEIMQRHDDRNATVVKQAQNGRRDVMIDVVDVANIGPCSLEQLPEIAPRFERVDDLRGASDVARYRIGLAEFDLVDELFVPFGLQILGVPHRERYDPPADLLEQAIVLEEDRFSASANVVVVVD
jgi:hypothetical protein